MRRIEEVGKPFAGKPVTLISAGESTADYLSETTTDDVVLINWALSLAPLFTSRRVYHVSLHNECFVDHACWRLPNVIPITGDWAKFPDELDEKSFVFPGVQFDDLGDPQLAERIKDPDGCLCHVQNSSHCAIHLAWLWGCRDLRIIGADGFRGLPAERYDPRLKVPADRQSQGSPGWYYLESFRRFVGLFDWDRVTWIGY